MRKLNSLKNLLTTAFSYVILALLGFVRIKVFISSLGEEIYSINQLFYQIFAYLSIAEAGVGALICQKYYKLLIEKKTDDINVIHTTARSFLRKISLGMFIVGVIISFGLKFLTNNSLSLGYMQIVFMLFMIRNLIDYLMYTPRLLMQADQKSYATNSIVNAYKIIEIALEIVLLYNKVNYAYILIPTIIIRIIMNYFVNKRVYREYPWLKVVEKKDNSVLKESKYILGIRVATIVANNTDILIVSKFLTPLAVTIYSSYNYIIKFAIDAANLVLNALVASFGNVMHSKEDEKKSAIFEQLNSLFICLASFLAVAMAYLLSKLVNIWLGADKIIDPLSLIFMVIILYQNVSRLMFNAMRDVQGWFKQTQWIAYIEGIGNIVLSIILLQYFDMAGILLATVLINAFTSFLYYPIYTYKKLFNKKPILYYVKFFANFAFAAVLIWLSYKFGANIQMNNYFELIYKGTIYMGIVGLLILLFNYICFKDFRDFMKNIKSLIIDILNKKKAKQENNV